LSELPPPRPAPAADTDKGTARFAYPCTFLPVAYNTDTSLPTLLSQVIPAARESYDVRITLPPADTDAMAVDAGEPVRAEARLRSDGLLLYVAAAIYEPGTSPLSLWVPNVAWRPLARDEGSRMDEDAPAPMDLFERCVSTTGEPSAHANGERAVAS
jgi:snurportin-1